MALPRHNATSHTNGYVYAPRRSSIEISPYSSKFRPQQRTAYKRRRATLIRVICLLFGVSFLVFLLSPSLRWTVFPSVGLGFLLSDNLDADYLDYYDLSNYQGSGRGWEREERILFCAPFRDAAVHLPMFFSHLKNITYPHHLIDLAFLVSDSKDNTLPLLVQLLEQLQADKDPSQWFGEISVIEKDFGQAVGQDFSNRHGFAAQGPRRKLMARARNWLLNAALKPHHSWVYWRDADVETAPPTILEDLMRHNKDVIVPNVWRPLPDWLGGEQPYDLNSWQESETGLELASKLDEDAVIVEGYAEYATWRPHLAYLRDPYGDPDMEMEIDGVGGVSILAKAKVFRQGVHFPAFSFEKHAETEGFGKMAKRMKFSVIGLPHYTIWHLYEPSADDLKHMAEMEQQRIEREKAEKEEAERKKAISEGWQVKKEDWDKDQKEILDAALKNKDKDKHQQEAAQAETQLKKLEEQAKDQGGKLQAPKMAPGAQPVVVPAKPVSPEVKAPGADLAKDPGDHVLDKPAVDKDGKVIDEKPVVAAADTKPAGKPEVVLPPNKAEVVGDGKSTKTTIIDAAASKPELELKGGNEGPIAHVGEPGVGEAPKLKDGKPGVYEGHENGIMEDPSLADKKA